MAWVNWSRRTLAERQETGDVGIELNAARVRAALGRSAYNRAVPLEGDHLDLPLAINLDGRLPEVGRAGTSLIRRLPHACCSGYLPMLGQSQEWKWGRHRLRSGEALALALGRLRDAVGNTGRLFLGLPSYLTVNQVTLLRTIAAKHSIELAGTASTALAIAADRAGAVMSHRGHDAEVRAEGTVPLKRPGQLPTDALIIDADDEAMTGNLIRIGPKQVTLLACSLWSHVGVKHWKNRLIDQLSDRCVRVCRRDPRDSAEAEQSLYDQIDACLDPLRGGQHATLNVRAAHWYQDIHVQAEDLDAACLPLIRDSVEGILDLQNTAAATEPPRAVWLTHEAGRLPGLAKAIYQHLSEHTSVGVLRPEAPAIAIANLAERWPAAEHLDTSIMLPTRPVQAALPAGKVHSSRN